MRLCLKIVRSVLLLLSEVKEDVDMTRRLIQWWAVAATKDNSVRRRVRPLKIIGEKRGKYEKSTQKLGIEIVMIIWSLRTSGTKCWGNQSYWKLIKTPVTIQRVDFWGWKNLRSKEIEASPAQVWWKLLRTKIRLLSLDMWASSWRMGDFLGKATRGGISSWTKWEVFGRDLWRRFFCRCFLSKPRSPPTLPVPRLSIPSLPRFSRFWIWSLPQELFTLRCASAPL